MHFTNYNFKDLFKRALAMACLTILALIPFNFLACQEQSILVYSLEEIIKIAKQKSIAAQQANTLKTTRYWEWRNFQSTLKPRLVLDGTLPDFNRTFREVIQPSGTLDFQPISNNNSNVGLSLSQNIPLTGGTLFVQSQLQRFDDFRPRKTLYNGTPIAIGISQPLFQFNPWKWDKQIEPLKYQESVQQYSQDLENIAVQAVDLFFNLITAQINWQIARTNQSNTDTLLAIAQERFNLGKASRNDLLQLKLETLNARKALATADQDLQTQRLRLRSFIGYRDALAFELSLPEDIPLYTVDLELSLREAFANRPDATGFRRQELEALRAVAEAKGTTGLQVSLFGTFGLSKSGTSIAEVLDRPQDSESLLLQFSLPILDWGRAKSQIETAKANQQLIQFQVEQDQIDFEQEILTQVTLLEMNRLQVKLTKEADEIATERYGIAQERFILGDLSITDLSIALQEKDRAKRDYILALWEFWAAHFNLKRLTLFDFEQGKKLK